MSLLIILTTVGVVFGAIIVYLSVFRTKKQIPSSLQGHEIPGPTPLPILYNTIDYLLNKDDTLTWYLQQAEKHKYNFKATMPLLPVGNFICDPRDVEYVLKTRWENFNKGEAFVEKSTAIFGNGIFNVNGALWKHQRQTASHLFKVNTMKDMAVTFVKHGLIVEDILTRRNGQVVDVQDLFHRYTLDSMGEVGFGKEIGSLHSDDVPFARNFDKAQNQLEDAFYNPLWKFLPHNDSALKVINDFSYSVIKERKSDPNVDKKTDLLSRYLCLKDEEDQPFTDKYLRDIVINFMIAGRDTTAQTLTWTVYLLSQDPIREQKVLDEIHSTLNGATPNYDNVKDMKYLKAVLNESLRLYPPVPLDPKTAVEDDVLPSGSRVYKGDYVIWCAYMLGRIKDFWGEDVASFNPERWLDEERVAKYHPFQFVPFQAGPRICLGQNMAYLEAKILLCMLLPKFSFKLAPDFIVTYRRSVTLPAKYGMKMIISPRESPVCEKEVLCEYQVSQ